jgi:hypothetical protein
MAFDMSPPTPAPADFAALATDIAAQLKGFKGSLDQLLTLGTDAIIKWTTPLSESSKVPVKDLLVFNRPLRLQTATVYNAALSLRWVQFHNALSAVPNGASADLILPVAGQSVATLDFRQGPFFSNGLYVCASTTDTTKTLTLTNDIVIFCTFSRA